MKIIKYILIIAIISCTSLAENIPNNILDYYNYYISESQKTSSLFKVFPYKLKLINNKWLTSNNMLFIDGKPLEFDVTVDIKNGYINITDEGTGGGSEIYIYALFTTDTNEKYLAVNHQSSGVGTGAHFIKFYKYVNGSFHDKTNDIFPVLKYEYFFKKDYYKNNKNYILKIISSLQKYNPISNYIYILPRLGTSIKIVFPLRDYVTSYPDYLSKRDQNDNIIQLSKSELNELKIILSNIERTEIELTWDDKKGIFKIK